MNQNSWHRHRRHGLALAATLCCAAAQAQAQAQTAQSNTPEPTQLERINVTGSHIRRVDLESALPVQVITAEEIRRSGNMSVTEVLQSLTANGAGGMTDTASFGSFAYGASGVSLRSLGPTATLILINGRRLAPYSVPDINNGLTNFVNVDAIPRTAIKRIEVLKDGASAIYGSDAMAGVVNIILRDDYESTEVEAQLRSSVKGGFGNQWAALTTGRGNLRRDGWNWVATVDVNHRDEVMLADVVDRVVDARHHDNSFYYTAQPFNSRYTPTPNYYGGVSIDPATGASNAATRTGRASANCPSDNRWAFNSTFTPALNLCGYSSWKDIQYVSPTQRGTLFTHGEMTLGESASLFGELSLTRLTNKQSDWPVPFGSGNGATPNGRDGGVSYVPQFLPEGHPNNPFTGQPAGITYLFSDVGKQGIHVTNNTARLLVGLRGTYKDWDWETGVMHARDTADVSYVNRVSLPVLRDAVQNGTYNFENPKAGSVTADQLRINPVDHGRTAFTMVDAKVSGQVGALPGGPINVAAGAEVRHEERVYNPDDRIFGGQVYLQVAGRTRGSRNVMSTFGEVELPLLKSLQAQVALRGDHYSDYGSSVTPKLGVAWAPVPTFKARASLSQGFRAPSLSESGKSDVPLFSYVNFDPKRCGDFKIDCDGYRNSGAIKASRDLKPERSASYGLGFVYEPVSEFSMTVDYWDVRRRNEIVFVDPQTVVDHEDDTSPLYAGRVHRSPADTVSIPGQSIPGRITTVDQAYLNQGRTQVRGVDVSLRGSLPLPGTAPLRVTVEATYLDRWRGVDTDDQPWVVNTGNLGMPRLRSTTGFGWSPGPWDLGATFRHLSGYRATVANQACTGARFLGVCDVGSYDTLDLTLAYRPSKAWTLRSTLLNATNAGMPFTPTLPLGNRYWYSPAGRMLSLSVRHEL
ncbi:TonB-dependent siderophore receptor [Pelomonas sp. Root1444]|uniref:TonB-dependent receptor plug domain-containing protein n=1 Tax=Pelomonas sp. Root1444 TaxID=1736464 RepID=UPI0009E708F7|nr:TonB-dependent receptor [Pelomonas sp. Root1444]